MSDRELDSWAGAWQSNVPDLGPLRKRAAREGLWLRVIVANDALGSLGCLAVAVWFVLDEPDLLRLVIAGGLAALGALGCVFTMQNWRGLWQDGAASVRDYLAQARARSAARLRWIRLGGWLLAAEMMFFGAVIAWRWQAGVDPGKAGRALVLLLVLCIAAGIFVGWLLRRERRNAAGLERMAAEIERET
ncbi:MAG: hypothetical protein MUC71_02655 [Steroidobacteraceae bacterium]|jgi:hypothetical protein|nr:hypothetical protein [Steroidobacteraceae bacterium]